MNTKLWSVDNIVDNFETCPQIIQAAQLLKKNEVVAFPTETVYGLGGNAFSDDAVDKIFIAKGRPSDNPLIVHIATPSQLQQLVSHIPESAQIVIDAFWPGPLTLIFQKKEGVLSDKVTAGLQTVAVRMPDHPIALAVIKSAGLPIAAPSANQSGKPSPTTAGHVAEDLMGRIAGIMDGGPTGVGVESTVLDCTGEIPIILRPGGITKEQLEEVLGCVEVDPALMNEKSAPKSPGMKYRHYAPNAPLYLVEGDAIYMQKLISEKQQIGLKVGAFITEENRSTIKADKVVMMGSREDLLSISSSLYDGLRSFNGANIDVIFGEVLPTTGLGHAIMNRLQKAAGNKVFKEER